LKDTLKHQGLRNQLIKTLIHKGINDEHVLKAIAKIPRHLFMNSSFETFAYQDKAFPIGANQTISQPYTVAFQTEKLLVKQGSKILEIGTGSGYQTAVLLELKAKVYTVERQKELFKSTSLFLPKKFSMIILTSCFGFLVSFFSSFIFSSCPKENIGVNIKIIKKHL